MQGQDVQVCDFASGYTSGNSTISTVEKCRFESNEQQDLLFKNDQYKYTWGFIAWCCLLVSTVLSLGFIRRAQHELFIVTHFVFVVFLAAVYLHTPVAFLPYLIAAAVFYGNSIIS